MDTGKSETKPKRNLNKTKFSNSLNSNAKTMDTGMKKIKPKYSNKSISKNTKTSKNGSKTKSNFEKPKL